jgi:HSP20 family protein
MAQKQTEITPREGRLARREPLARQTPLDLFERFADEVDRIFEDFGFGRAGLAPRTGRGLLPSPWRGATAESGTWAPEIEVFHRGNDLVVRTDLPGLSKDDVKVDVTDDRIIIQGERKREHEEEREGFYRSERSYGSFTRVVPLPEGAITEQAKASFKDGVLEITMPAPPEEVRRGRRLEIGEGTSAKK